MTVNAQKSPLAKKHSDEISSLIADAHSKLASSKSMAKWKAPLGWRVGKPLPKGWPAMPVGWSVSNSLAAKRKIRTAFKALTADMRAAVKKQRVEANAA